MRPRRAGSGSTTTKARSTAWACRLPSRTCSWNSRTRKAPPPRATSKARRTRREGMG